MALSQAQLANLIAAQDTLDQAKGDANAQAQLDALMREYGLKPATWALYMLVANDALIDLSDA